MTLPELHLADWRPTKDTLHLYAQIVGKIRLATHPRNHWWNASLYVDVRGLTTRRLHHRDTTFEIRLDFVEHALIIQTADGRNRSFELGDGLPIADFDARLHAMLAELGIDVEIKEQPFGVPMTTPFPEDVEHASWDRGAVERFGRILDWSTPCSRSSAAGSTARRARCTSSGTASTSPSRASQADPAPRSTPIPSRRRRTPTRPIPFGFCRRRRCRRCHLLLLHRARARRAPRKQLLSAGGWIEDGAGALAVLPYETVRSARDPRTTLLAFCQSAYEAGACLAGWDTSSFESNWCPTPGQLNQLHATAAAEFGRPSAST